MAEGRQIEFLEPSTKGIEIKQGPIPAAIAGEMVVHGSLPGPAAVTKNTL